MEKEITHGVNGAHAMHMPKIYFPIVRADRGKLNGVLRK